MSTCEFVGVMSSRLYKKLEGAAFPLWIKSVKDREEDSIHALDVDKANHRPGSASHLHEAALDDVGGAQLSPEVSGEMEETEHLWQVTPQ